MRLKQNRLKQYSHRRAIPRQDNEGNSYVEYDAEVLFKAEMWAGGGKLQSEIYGIRLPNIRNLRVQGGYSEISNIKGVLGYQVQGGPCFSVNDGICLCVPLDAAPDYKIIAIYPYQYLTLELERI